MSKKDDKKGAKNAKSSIPKCPEKDERGDKTPAVVEWYKKYKPAEYKRKYHAFEAAKVRGKVR